VTVLDPYAFVAHWGAVDTDPEAVSFTPLPKHLLEPFYLQDKDALANSRFFTTEFVGTGPFKLARWEPGSFMDFQRFDEYYRRPVNGMTQMPVRQALLQAIDRETLMQTMAYGLSDVAHSFYFPGDPSYPFVKDSFPIFPYDPRRSQELLASAGWSRGSDGTLV